MNHPFSPYVCRRPLFGTSSDPSKDFIELKMAMDREAGVLSKSIAFACPLLRRARGMKCGGSTPPLANLGYSVPEHLASLRPLISYPAWAPAAEALGASPAQASRGGDVDDVTPSLCFFETGSTCFPFLKNYSRRLNTCFASCHTTRLTFMQMGLSNDLFTHRTFDSTV